MPARADGTVDPEEVKKQLSPEVAAIMLTNPNTCGLFERDVVAIADAVHAAGAYFYADGANFNAIVGKVRPGDLGVDAMHINLHKTFSTPHGGGGPGAGPVVLSDGARALRAGALRRALTPTACRASSRHAAEAGETAKPFGRMYRLPRPDGHVRARARLHARRTAPTACARRPRTRCSTPTTSAPRLADLMTQPFGDRPCMHEVLFDDHLLEGTGVTTLDFAKAMIDEGYHPMTVYFPLVVHGAMLIEPTESELKASLDLFIATLRDLAMRPRRGEAERFHEAPRLAPRRRLDETRAAREPRLRWTAPEVRKEAAE